MTGETVGPETPASVFISYRRSDRESADRLYELLGERQVAAWYDPLIPPSADWREAIVEHLSAARVMVVLLSSAALDSEELRKELAVASQEGVQLLAVRLEDVEPRGAFAYELARNNWFDVFGNPPERLAALADLLAELVKTPRGVSPEPRPRDARRLPARGLAGLASNPARLAVLFLVFAVIEFLLYDHAVRPLEHLTNSGVPPVTAVFYVACVVTLGSPMLFVTLLQRGVAASDLPLLIAAAANTVILILLVRFFLSWLHRLLGKTSR
jgi:hypothetical protein